MVVEKSCRVPCRFAAYTGHSSRMGTTLPRSCVLYMWWRHKPLLRKDLSTELDTPSSPPPSRELPVVLTWCCSECQFESRMDRGMFIFHWSVENPWTCLVGKISSFRSTQYQNTTEFIQFKPMKLMVNHGTKTTQGACCISTMRIRGAAPHGVWMTVHKMERMIGFEVVGSNHRIQAVHL